MSSEALPISPQRFASAIKDLPLSTLHLKVLELRNSIAHLDYSNEQLRPFAEGKETALSPASGTQVQQPPQGQGQGEPDQDCVDAIAENEAVIARMEERIRLIRAEVEGRGQSWDEFRSEAEVAANRNSGNNDNNTGTEGEATAVNGTSGSRINGEQHEAWRDGTFQTGIIRNGEIIMDENAGGSGTSRPPGGTLTDEELRRRVEEQMRALGEDDENGGMHL